MTKTDGSWCNTTHSQWQCFAFNPVCQSQIWTLNCRIAPLLNNVPQWDFFDWNSSWDIGSAWKWKQHDSRKSLLMNRKNQSRKNKCNWQNTLVCTMTMHVPCSSCNDGGNAATAVWIIPLMFCSGTSVIIKSSLPWQSFYMTADLPLMKLRNKCTLGFRSSRKASPKEWIS